MDQQRALDERMDVASAPSQRSQDGGGEAYCPICGKNGDTGLGRFGQLFCSEAHVAQYASERRAQTDGATTSLVTVDAKNQGNEGTPAMACGIATKGGLRKMGWCLAGGVGLLIALPLIASGGVAAAAGSLLTVAAFLACPIGMYFMMRGMMKTNQRDHPNDKADGK